MQLYASDIYMLVTHVCVCVRARSVLIVAACGTWLFCWLVHSVACGGAVVVFKHCIACVRSDAIFARSEGNFQNQDQGLGYVRACGRMPTWNRTVFGFRRVNAKAAAVLPFVWHTVAARAAPCLCVWRLPFPPAGRHRRWRWRCARS
jgi:hypothetical protein